MANRGLVRSFCRAKILLTGANLSGADLSDADLSNADLCDANLRGADLSGASLLNTAYDDRTAWPAGFDPRIAGAFKR